MEVCKPVLELKDVPPPPVHSGVPKAHACPVPPHTPPGLSVSVCSVCELLLPACAALRPLPCPGSALCLCRRAPHSFPRAEPPVCPSALHTPLCVAAAHCVQDCWRQGVRVDPEKVWPNIPPPVPVCNGCGATGAPADGLLGVHLGKPAQKYGPPESGAQESLPPIGVFWDIENCAVPSGRSAAAVVQRLRERFFQGHREAEFICVCDINKENKAVIQELNNCQVTVAHINATAKNAADDKLRQSLRRFAETHTAPATVIVVSSDVNFGSELSDLRHRHGFQVILLHKSQASPALLQHAHRCTAFEELVSGLPPGMQIRTQPSVSLLFVHRLPMHRDAKAVANRLQRLSNNCGGKVLGVSGGCAVLRFASAEAAERARKRMENEDVLGQRILVSHSRDGPDEGEELRPPAAAALFLPVEKPRSPRRQRRASRSCHAPERPYSPRNAGHASSCSPVMKPLPQAVCGATRPATASPQSNTLLSAPGRPAELPQRSRRRDSPGQLFQVSTPSAFSKLSLQRSFSPMMLSHSSWSSRSASPCPSSRSSPRSVPSPSGCVDEPQPFSDGADLQVSNLDYRLPRTELQQSLRDAFARHGRVKSVDLSPHTDYQLKARVHMSSLQQAISAVSLLHRYKIGSKRIQVSLVTGASNKSLTCLSSEIISILQDAPANCLPLYKFTETYERKFAHKLAVGDLYRLPELVCVREQGGGRLVCLLSNTQIRQSPLGSSHTHTHDSSNTASPVLFEELEYHEPVCKRHCAQQDFSEADFDPDSYMIPFVLESLKVLATHVHSLLQSHEGMLPLLSFPDCYAAEFSALSVAEEGQLEGSVPLEHLITCIPGVTIVTAQNGFKVIKWIHNKPPPPNADLWLQRSKSPVGNPQLIQFSREMVDLMRSQPSCLMPVSRFIPAYHHHFAKQCRVSDYGYTKLLELLEAVPHVLQILGLGSKRLLTLTHRAQVKRFTQDLLKLLKLQASKQVPLQGFGSAYHWCFSRDWQVVDYGMCDLMDLLSEIPDSTISVCQQEVDVIISVPKRERSAEEAERTRQFGREVVDLLRHQPHFRMPFSRFIPTYHHHFGRQCKLSYYGFSKLMELFEAIPDILQVLECGEERLLVLTEVERVKALAAQLVKLLRAQRDSGLPVCRLLGEYSKTFGYCLRLQDYEASTLPALLHRLCHVVKVVDTPEGKEVQLINRKSLRALTCQLLALMMSLPEERSDVCVEELRCQYELSYGAPLNPCEYGFISLAELLKSLPYLLQLSEDEGGGEERVRLTRLYQFARRVRALLLTFHYSQLFLSEFSSAFSKHSGETLYTHSYGYNTLEELLAAIPQVVWIKGHGHKKIIVLKNDMRARGSPALTDSPADEPHPEEELRAATSPASGELELLCLSSSSAVDLLCAPVPSCLPSPALRPDPVQPPDLMHFQPPVHHQPRPANGSDPAQPTAGVWDSPARRSARSRVRLAANFSFTAAQPV